jgi:hybrid cluster-associated redox disulfide protein
LDQITKDSNLLQVVKDFPETIPVFMSFGLGCIGCAVAKYETVEQGANGHGINADALVEELNKTVNKKVAK